MSLHFDEVYELVLSEINKTLSEVDGNEAERLIEEILKAEKIFFIGAGRMGIMLTTFCMRLHQLGFKSFIIGSITCEPITEKDLLIVASSSGETLSTLVLVKKALEFDARVFTITAKLDSTIAKLSVGCLLIKGPSSIEAAEENVVFSKQPMKTLFSQSLFILLDSIVFMLMKKTRQDAAKMAGRHTNLE